MLSLHKYYFLEKKNFKSISSSREHTNQNCRADIVPHYCFFVSSVLITKVLLGNSIT